MLHFIRSASLPVVAGLAVVLSLQPALAQTDEVVDLPTRPGQSMRLLLLKPAAKAEASVATLVNGVRDAFAFDLVFHLREGGQDCEPHTAHRCCCVDVASTQVQTRKPAPLLRSASAKASMF
jgi:hypothetical protein